MADAHRSVVGAGDAPHRFLCDAMLRGISRWLRAAGYDTALVDDRASDGSLLARAAAERRIVLTCDRRLATRSDDQAPVVTLGSAGLDVAARELRERLGIDWLCAPFTRCLLDNAPLRSAGPADLANVPETARCSAGPITACPQCQRVYWPGSHARRMRARLERWQREPLP